MDTLAFPLENCDFRGIRQANLLALCSCSSDTKSATLTWIIARGEEEYMAAALAYLEEQKAALSGAESISVEIDPQTDISGYDIDKVISWIKKATQEPLTVLECLHRGS